MKIVRYSPKHEREVKKLIFGILKELGSPPAPEEHSDEDLDNIEKIYSGRGKFWVALSGGKLVGTVGIKEKSKRRAKLKRMFVLKDFRGTGLAQKLLNKAKKHAQKMGFEEIELWTSNVMERAQNFYEKNGFKFVEKNKWAKRYLRRL
jgi:N-acetylglutamate synthase-like GNAT family acetyltransferase